MNYAFCAKLLTVNGVLLKQKTGKKHQDKILYKE